MTCNRAALWLVAAIKVVQTAAVVKRTLYANSVFFSFSLRYFTQSDFRVDNVPGNVDTV